jgi:hypothetical protein
MNNATEAQNNPLYPPYFKGEREGNNPYFRHPPLKIRGAR